MVAVAVVALALGGIIGGVRLKRRHDDFLVRVRAHERMAKWLSYTVRDERESLRRLERELGQTDGRPLKFLENQRQFWDYIERREVHHAAMALKYERAARYPWLPVEPDPPEP